MNTLIALAVIAFFPVGVKCISHYSNVEGENMILWRFGKLMGQVVKRVPEMVAKPLWTCPRCMCLLWGVPAALGVAFGPWWVASPLILVSAIGVQELLDR